MINLLLPPRKPGNGNETWAATTSAVIIGGNGTGKSRLGSWIEENNPVHPVHRVSAQRALNLPDLIDPVAHERATSQLYYGTYQPTWHASMYPGQKRSNRWSDNPVGHLLSDFPLVMSTLFSDQAKRDREYAIAGRNQVPTTKTQDCNLDILQRIWAAVFPHRDLIVGQDRIAARVPNGAENYAGSMMSDGERVALYLLGQVLCAPPTSIIVIDEPEIHLNRAIQASLWDAAEASRPDCVFVYITHDVEFAATRSGARKLWTKDYDGVVWHWEEIQSSPDLPDELLFAVLGSRRPVLFTEGDRNSYDATLYRVLYPGWLVRPLASCRKVIDAHRTMQQLSSLHHLTVHGLVDRDHRSSEEINALRNLGLQVADVAEVENLFCTPSALCAVAAQVKTPDSCGVIEAAKERVISELRRSMNAQVAARAIAEIQFRLSGFGPKAGNSDAAGIQSELQKYVGGIDVAATFQQCSDLFGGIVQNADYDAALRYYNCKGIISFVAGAFGLKPQTYCEIVTGIIRSDVKGALAADLRTKIS
jgi:Protein of unknown function (DUF4435)/AAA domain, putative AbiEii toxin, Type IV TA system